MSELDDMDLIFGPDDEDRYEAEAPALETSEQADESLRRIAYYQAKLEHLVAPFNAEIERLEQRRDEVCAPVMNKVEWHRGALEAFHRAALAAKWASPTLKLPHGQSLLKQRKPKLVVTDEAELLAWAAGEGIDLLPNTPKPKVMAGKLNEAVSVVGGDDAEPGATLPVVSRSGEVVPGVEAVAQEASFSMKGTK